MNKKYYEFGDKVIVFDQNKKGYIRENSENIGEILTEENIIESLEEELNDLEDENIKASESYLKNGIKRLISPLVQIFSGLGAIVLFNATNIIKIITSLLGDDFVMILNSLFIAIGISGVARLFNSIYYPKIVERKLNAINYTMPILEEKLEESKNRLQELTKSEEDILEKPATKNKVKYKKALNELRDYLVSCYNFGYNEDKYLKYYKSGKLTERLQEVYSPEEISKIEAYLSQKVAQEEEMKRNRTLK